MVLGRISALLLTALLVGAVVGAGAGAAVPAQAASEPVDLVNVFTGTTSRFPDFGTGGGAGNTSPAATMPFGMVQWGPDTHPSVDNFAGGYTWTDERIRGFSLTHLSGPGCAMLQDVPVMPIVGAPASSPATFGSTAPGHTATFDHDHESASPGRYAVTLSPGTPDAIEVDLGATMRTGHGRFTFPAGQGSLLFDLGGSASGVDLASVEVDPDAREIRGTVQSGHFCYLDNTYRLHLVARFDRDLDAFGTWEGQELTPGGTTASRDVGRGFRYTPVPGAPNELPNDAGWTAQVGAYATFDTDRDADVEVRIGISFVSLDGARANLAAERHATLAEVQAAARRAWSQRLASIGTAGGSDGDRVTLATALYHSLLHPNVSSDVTGEYVGADGAVHRAEAGDHLTNFSGWDVYRTQVPLLALLAPDRAADLARSLLATFDQTGALPRWEAGNKHTPVMVGDPSPISLATVDAFGLAAVDPGRALAAMVDGATRSPRTEDGFVQRPGLLEYERLGYIPIEENVPSGAAAGVDAAAVWGTSATTMEYALADDAIRRFAARQCDDATAAAFAVRAQRWREVVNPATGFAEPRSATGRFRPGTDPASGEGFVEGSGAQYTWSAPHDPHGLVEAVGGPAAAVERLDEFFTELNAGPESDRAFLGNEPSLHVPWLYHWLGRPDRTQAVVRDAMQQLYSATPDGIPGNDDLGTLSAWYAWAAIGLYPVTPGTDLLAVHVPAFDEVVLRLASGPVVVRVDGPSDGSVRAVRVDGRLLPGPFVAARELAEAALVEVVTAPDQPTSLTAPGDPGSDACRSATPGPDQPSAVDATTEPAPPLPATGAGLGAVGAALVASTRPGRRRGRR